MTAVLLSIHVLAAIVLIGPMTAAASLFPRYARAAGRRLEPEDPASDDGRGTEATAVGAAAVARAMHRISRGYAVPAIVVPVFGVATAQRMNALGQPWLWASMVLTAVAALLLVVWIVPGQRRVLAGIEVSTHPARHETPSEIGPHTDGRGQALSAVLLARLGMTTGVFALTWAVVVVLMIVRPGSTTGVAP